MGGWLLYLTCKNFVRAVREALATAGIELDDYAGHSFQIGVATTAAQCGIQESTIKCWGVGRVQHTCCISRPPRETLSAVAKVLVAR